jgi:hypothetical protein
MHPQTHAPPKITKYKFHKNSIFQIFTQSLVSPSIPHRFQPFDIHRDPRLPTNPMTPLPRSHCHSLCCYVLQTHAPPKITKYKFHKISKFQNFTKSTAAPSIPHRFRPNHNQNIPLLPTNPTVPQPRSHCHSLSRYPPFKTRTSPPVRPPGRAAPRAAAPCAGAGRGSRGGGGGAGAGHWGWVAVAVGVGSVGWQWMG